MAYDSISPLEVCCFLLLVGTLGVIVSWPRLDILAELPCTMEYDPVIHSK